VLLEVPLVHHFVHYIHHGCCTMHKRWRCCRWPGLASRLRKGVPAWKRNKRGEGAGESPQCEPVVAEVRSLSRGTITGYSAQKPTQCRTREASTKQQARTCEPGHAPPQLNNVAVPLHGRQKLDLVCKKGPVSIGDPSKGHHFDCHFLSAQYRSVHHRRASHRVWHPASDGILHLLLGVPHCRCRCCGGLQGRS
jgi:hypothetical protein